MIRGCSRPRRIRSVSAITPECFKRRHDENRNESDRRFHRGHSAHADHGVRSDISWFVDIDESTVTVSTGKVIYDTDLYLDDGETGSNTVTLENLVANRSHTIKVKIDNRSTVDTVYRIYAKIDSANGLAAYDYKNILINGISLGNGTEIPDVNKEIPIVPWSNYILNNDPYSNLRTHSFIVSTLDTYGSAEDGKPYTSGGWSMDTDRTLSFKVVVEAYQGDYPYDGHDNLDSIQAGTKITDDTVSGNLSINYNGVPTDVSISISNLSAYDGKILAAYMEYHDGDFILHLAVKDGDIRGNDVRVSVTLPESRSYATAGSGEPLTPDSRTDNSFTISTSPNSTVRFTNTTPSGGGSN